MNNQFRISRILAGRLTEHKLALPNLLRLAGLPPGFFQREKIYATTAELFALWRAVGELSPDPEIGLKLGVEPRFERYQPTAIAAVCSRSFRDALQRIARYKQLTCPEEIRVLTTGEEASVEVVYTQAQEVQPDVLVEPSWNSAEEILRILERMAWRLSRRAKTMKVRAHGKPRRMPSRWLSRLGRSTSTKRTSSAPAWRQRASSAMRSIISEDGARNLESVAE